MRIHRLISILLTIERSGKIKAKDLAKQLETSIRTIYRDIDLLNEAGIPLVTTPGPDGGIQFINGYNVKIENLAQEELTQLYLSSYGVIPQMNSEGGLNLNNALLKLQQKLPNEFHPEIDVIQKRFYFDDTTWWNEYKPIIEMDLLIKSILDTFKLKIHYLKMNGQQSIRTIHPYGLVIKRMEWYLIGYCEVSKGIRVFKCERFTEVLKVDDSFNIPKDFHLEHYWRMSERGFKELCYDQEVYPVRIKLNVSYRNLLDRFEIIDLKQEGHDLIVKVNFYTFEYACHNLLELIGCCEVTEPIDLRNEIKKKLIIMLNNYENTLYK